MVFSTYDKVLEVARKKIFYSQHALDQMNKPERLISPEEVGEVIFHGELIEDYPEDPRGSSCLFSGKTQSKRTIHVVCAPQNEYLLIVTSYVPNLQEWDIMFKERKR